MDGDGEQAVRDRAHRPARSDGSGASRGPSHVLASSISALTNPKLTIFALLLYITVVQHASASQTLFLAAYVIVAALCLARLKAKATTTDSYEFTDPHHRAARYQTFAFFIVLGAAFLVFAQQSSQPTFERHYFLLTILVTTILLFITWRFHFKMSAHLTFLGTLILYALPTGYPKYPCFLAATAIVGWARLRLHNHDRLQVFATIGYIMMAYVLWDYWT